MTNTPFFSKPSLFVTLLLTIALFSCTLKARDRQKTTISGSNTEAPVSQLLADAYLKKHPDARWIEIASEGSFSGIDELISGKVDIANSSRKMTTEEFEQARKNGVQPIEVIIANDALCIITNPRLGVDSLSIEQIRGIYAGKITNWKTVGGPDASIRLYGRNTLSGTRDYLEKSIIGAHSHGKLFERDNTQDVIEILRKDPYGIGYAGIGNLMQDGKPTSDVWVMNIYSENLPAVSPFERSKVISGEYLLSRPLYQYFNGIPTGEIMRFLQFEISTEGQEIVHTSGFYPILETHKALNRENGIYPFTE